MAVGEFELIRKYFSGLQDLSPGVVLGIGDDAAILEISPEEQLVVATDTLVEGVHFPVGTGAEHIAARTLLTNLSDLAAMGAEPRWFTLALTLPTSDEQWLAGFSAGLARVATAYGCALVGGDTTRGPLTVTITVHGVVPRGVALTRAGAKPGDHIFVTGTPGLGAAGLAYLQGELSVEDELKQELLSGEFLNPYPQLDVGKQLRGVATAAIDISDGLVADLNHICRESGVGAELELELLPQLSWLADQVSAEKRRHWVLSGGDDYELCFTVPEVNLVELDALIAAGLMSVTRIGRIVSGSEVHCLDKNKEEVSIHKQGYKHF